MNNSFANRLNLLILKDYVDAFPLPFVILSPVIMNNEVIDFIFEYANKAAAESNNISAEEFIGRNMLDIHPGHKDNGVFSALAEVYRTGNPWSKAINYKGPSGSSAISGYFTLYANRKNEFILAGWAEFTDIKLSEENLRKSEENLKISLKEKELLVREAHHRIKNNLQLISSLIRLQTSENSELDSNLFRTIENKIFSISLLHEHLYQRTSLATVNLGTYLSDLIKYLLSTNDHGKIELSTDINEIEIETDRAVSLGLIINELITNCIKHAFIGTQRGIIRVSLKKTTDTIILSVSDNGKGLPTGFILEESKSLGLQLVNMMSVQLAAKLFIKSDNGTTFELQIKV